MKLFSQVSEDINLNVMRSGQSSDLSSTQVVGSMLEAGKMNTQSMPQLSNQQNSPTPKEPELPLVLKNDKEGRNQLRFLITTAFDTQNTYGKDASQLKNMTDLFIMLLEDCSYPDVRKAFLGFLKKSPNMPTPSDIINKITPPEEEFQWSRSEYKRLKDEAIRGFISSQERDYLREFETAQRNGERIYP